MKAYKFVLSLFNLFKKKRKIRAPYSRITLLEKEHQIRNYEIDPISGTPSNTIYIYGYENGWLKLCCFGGQAHKIECNEKDVPSLILPIIDQNMDFTAVSKYCKDWSCWNYYEDFFSEELIIP